VGWGEIWAASLRDLTSARLATGTVWLPSAETDAVWVTDYPGRVQAPRIRLLDLNGRERAAAPSLHPFGAVPRIGVQGGLVYETSTGLDIWDVGAERFTTHLGTHPGFVGDANGRRLAWCESTCSSLHVTRVGGQDVVIAAPRHQEFAVHTARFSPDGRLLAVIATDWDVAAPRDRLVVVDAHAGTTVAARRLGFGSAVEGEHVAWSADSISLFVASHSHGEPETHLGWFRVDERTWDTTTLPFGGLLSFVAVEHDELPAVEEVNHTAIECPPPMLQPSGRTVPCSFRY
jgi:hypothetical protein